MAAPGTPSPTHQRRLEHVRRALEAAREAPTLAALQDARTTLDAVRASGAPVDAGTAQLMYELSYDLFGAPEDFRRRHVRTIKAVTRALKKTLKRAEKAAAKAERAEEAAEARAAQDEREQDLDGEEPRLGPLARFFKSRIPLKYSQQDGAAWIVECSDSLLADMLDFYEHQGKFTRRLAQYRPPAQPGDSVFAFPDAESIQIVIVGDVGAENRIRNNVLRAIKGVVRDSPAAIVHLGDVYYCGRKSECRNFLRAYNRVFPQATQPLFTIPGNHEYLAFGEGFFSVLAAGEPAGEAGPSAGNGGQRHSFFCLEYPQLKLMLVAMDTGLNSWPDSHKDDLDQTAVLHEAEAQWVRDKVERAESSGYKLILCSHHQVTSAFAPKPEFFEQLAHQALGTTTGSLLAWFWGHEHRLVVFDPAVLPGVLPPSTYLRRIPHMECVGHGSIPTRTDAYKKRIFDYRKEFQPQPYRYHEHTIAQNGFLVLTASKSAAKGVLITHYDSSGKKTGGDAVRYLPGFDSV